MNVMETRVCPTPTCSLERDKQPPSLENGYTVIGWHHWGKPDMRGACGVTYYFQVIHPDGTEEWRQEI